MQRLKELSPIALFAAITVALPVAISSFFSDRINEIDRMQALRSRMQAQIHDSIHSQYSARMRETRVLSRCGITAYVVTMLDAVGSEYTLYYDIDNGTPIRQDLLNGCSGRVTESAAEIIGK